ncbi:winged helix-turn-helix transcriptional regulator [Bacillus solitudinis]|uniref:winged helix-turn-helix transcriptional regulator n=1 Tax=Bacillus solitudinis TaxID=2014074 RepID=UPI000C248CB8|nr:helix-turn-helix domain-containing protein [Bacillus solitudinis]
MRSETVKTCVPTGVNLVDTGFGHTLSLIGGKYKMIILYWLSEKKVIRFNELKRSVDTVSFKTLSVMLKELEADGLIIREEFPQIPPKVEYSLSDLGRSLIPILDMMCQWGENNR